MNKKQEKRNKYLIGGVTIFLMISSLLAIIGSNFGNNNSTSAYNGIDFEQFQDSKLGNMWKAKINGQSFNFHFHPSNIEQIIINGSFENLKNSKSIFITYDNPVNTGLDADYILLSGFELKNSLMLLAKNINFGFLNNTGYDIPKINCLNATAKTPVIKIIRSNETKIVEKNNCITLYSNSQTDFFAVKDTLLYKILGVI